MNPPGPDYGALAGIVSLLPLHQGHCGKQSRSCIQRASDAFFGAVDQLGFRYGRFTFWREDLLGELKLATYSHSMSNFSKDWEATYREKKLFHHDPVLLASQLGHENGRVRYGTWRDALQASLDMATNESLKNKYLSVYALAEQHGVHDGVYFAFGSESHAIFISCANEGRSEIKVTDAVYKGLYALSVIMDAIIDNTLGCDFCIKSVTVDGEHGLTLTDKQANVLRIFARSASATAKSVARDLRVEPETVHFHLKQVRRILKQPRASGHALAKIAQELRLIQ
ncbi:MAG: hypothetical protein EP312_09315 [Gammaproteobacteria bacterium]|nr:MAG: hypothetical protein EP312_09315 [Gammaproteobacteria bacterium]